jgi:hypothetical protein
VKRRLGMLAGLVAAVCAMPVVLAQSADDAFRNGMRVRQDKQWTALAALMRQAIHTNPTEAPRRVGGFGPLGGKEYMPHFYLGEALLNLGDCSGALAAWEESERQGVIQKQRDELKLLQAGYAACEAKGYLPPGKFQPATQRAEAAVAAANTAGHALSQFVSEHQDVYRQEFRERHDRARSDAVAAQEKLSEAQRTRRAAEATEAVTLAERSLAAFRATRDDFEKLVTSVSRMSAEAQAAEAILGAAEALDVGIDTNLRSAPMRLGLPSALVAERQKGRDLVSAARQRLRPAGRQPSSAEIAEAAKLARDGQSVLTPVATQVAAIVKTAIEREVVLAARTAEETYVVAETKAKSIEQYLIETPPPADLLGQVTTEMGAVQNALTRGRRRLEAARRSADVAAIRAAAQSAIDVQAQIDKIGELLPDNKLKGFDVTPPMMEGARHFFEGRYQEAVQTLSEDLAQATAMPLQAHVRVLRSAALFALYVRSGEADESLRARARQEADACAALDPSFQPNPAAFGPRFIGFFHSSPQAAPRP